ncbi:tetratricopeptide repeat protein [Cobetia sp. 5-11-6-3]|uniref:tetratricopeptide repeat protein n=1 Tax=Cobetia sp. 5-11-6-3 TaxID=2737458 RepID=UPI001596FEEE|nr:tetratricopeptide repeat protein [Cobetia sp. 5-11-6-3]
MKLFISIVLLTLLLGCSNDIENKSSTAEKMIHEPFVVQIDNTGPSFFKNDKLRDIEYVRKEYLSGNMVKGYFYALLLLQSKNDIDEKKKGLKVLRDVWENGLVDAGFNLFNIYYQGELVDENKQKALSYLIKSAELGYFASQRKLGLLYSGDDTYIDDLLTKDSEKAFAWFVRAAKNNDKLSAVNVAYMLYNGVGVKKSDKKAFEWLLKATKMPAGSNTSVYMAIGRYYEKGIGTNIDLVQAYKYYDQLQPAKDKDKIRIMKSMTNEEIAKAKRLSLELQEETNTYVMPR